MFRYASRFGEPDPGAAPAQQADGNDGNGGFDQDACLDAMTQTVDPEVLAQTLNGLAELSRLGEPQVMQALAELIARDCKAPGAIANAMSRMQTVAGAGPAGLPSGQESQFGERSRRPLSGRVRAVLATVEGTVGTLPAVRPADRQGAARTAGLVAAAAAGDTPPRPGASTFGEQRKRPLSAQAQRALRGALRELDANGTRTPTPQR